MNLHTPITENYIAHLWSGLELILGVYQYADHEGQIYHIFMINDTSHREYILKMTIDSYFNGSGLRFSEMKTEIESKVSNAHEIKIMSDYIYQKFEKLFEKYNEAVNYIKQCSEDKRSNSIELIANDFGDELAQNIDLKLNIRNITDNLHQTNSFFKRLLKISASTQKEVLPKEGKNFSDILLKADDTQKQKILDVMKKSIGKSPSEIAPALYALNELGYIDMDDENKMNIYRAYYQTFGYRKSINALKSGVNIAWNKIVDNNKLYEKYKEYRGLFR